MSHYHERFIVKFKFECLPEMFFFSLLKNIRPILVLIDIKFVSFYDIYNSFIEKWR